MNWVSLNFYFLAETAVRLIVKLGWSQTLCQHIVYMDQSPLVIYHLWSTSGLSHSIQLSCAYSMACHVLDWVCHGDSYDAFSGLNEELLQRMLSALESSILELPHDVWLLGGGASAEPPAGLAFACLHEVLEKKGFCFAPIPQEKPDKVSCPERSNGGGGGSSMLVVDESTFHCVSRLRARLGLFVSSYMNKVTDMKAVVEMAHARFLEHEEGLLGHTLRGYAVAASMFQDPIVWSPEKECAAEISYRIAHHPNVLSKERLAWVVLHLLSKQCSTVRGLRRNGRSSTLAGIGKDAVSTPHKHHEDVEGISFCDVYRDASYRLKRTPIPWLLDLYWDVMERVEDRSCRRTLISHAVASDCCSRMLEELERDLEIAGLLHQRIAALMGRLSALGKSDFQVFGKESSKAADALGKQVAGAVAIAPRAFLEAMMKVSILEPQQANLFVCLLHELPCLVGLQLAASDGKGGSSVIMSFLRQQVKSSTSFNDSELAALEHFVLILSDSHLFSLYQETSTAGGSSSTFYLTPPMDARDVICEVTWPLLSSWNPEDYDAKDEPLIFLLFRLFWKLLQNIQERHLLAALLKASQVREMPWESNRDEKLVDGKGMPNDIQHNPIFLQTLLSKVLYVLDFRRRRTDMSKRGLVTSKRVVGEARRLATIASKAIAEVFPETAVHHIAGELTTNGMIDAPIYLDIAQGNCVLESAISASGDVYDVRTIWDLADRLAWSLRTWAIVWDTSRRHTNHQIHLEKLQHDLSVFCGLYPLHNMREALLIAMASTLPCCDRPESQGFLAGVQWTVAHMVDEQALLPRIKFGMRSRKRNGDDSMRRATRMAVSSAVVVEILCRAIHGTLLVPGLVAMAGEKLDDISGKATSPSKLRVLAASRLVDHLKSFCHDALSHLDGKCQAMLAVRAFREVCRCVTAIAPIHECCDFQPCLFNLVRLAKQSPNLLRLVEIEDLHESVGKLPAGELRDALVVALDTSFDLINGID